MAGQSITDKGIQPYTAEQFSDNNGVTFAGLNPVLGSLGVMIGLLKLLNAETQEYELINSWFLNPYEETQKGVTANPKAFGQLLGELLGQLGGNALGVPQTDPAILGTWNPIQYKNDADEYVPTGLYLVTVDNEAQGSTALGLGVLKKWEISGLEAEVWGLIPAIVINSDGSFALTFSDSNNINPISLGVAVHGADPANPIINENGIEFNGVKFSSNIFLAPEPAFGVTIELLSMKLAGDTEAKNYSLADLAAITPQQLLNTAADLFIGALSDQFTDYKEQILYMAPLFGLSSKVPNSELSLPILEWYELFKIVSEGGEPTVPFVNWFNSLTSSPESLKTWMTCLGGFLDIPSAHLKVSGDGSRQSPYQVPAIAIEGIGTVNFNLASIVVDDGKRYLYPGLAFAGEAIPLGSSDAVFTMEADLELAKFQLSGDLKLEFDLNSSINFSLAGKDDTLLLPPTSGYSIGSMRGGMSLGMTSGKVVPYLELVNVTIPGQNVTEDTPLEDASNEFGVVNLLSPGKLAEVGAKTLSGQLQQFLGLNNNPTVFQKSIAALIGLTNPAGAPEDWTTPPFSLDGIVDSIKDPITAWSSYYLSVLKLPATGNEPRPFTYLLKSFAALLQVGDAAVTVDGSGTPTDPWMVGISINNAALPAYLTAFEDTQGEDLQLAFGLNFAPQLELGGIKIIPTLGIDALRIALPEGKSAVANWLDSVYAKLELPEKLTTPPFGGATLSVSKSQLSAGWTQKVGWTWSMLVDSPTLELPGQDPITGADLNFSDQSSLQDLVTQSAQTFGPFFARALGLGLSRFNTKSSFFAAATLGLLTDFSQYELFEENGIGWTGFTELPLNSFDDPLGLLRNQIAANFDTPEKAKQQLSLLAWTLSSQQVAPETPGTGTFADPFQTAFPAGFNMPVWYNQETKVIGLGVGRNDRYQYPNATAPTLQVEIVSRLNALEYNLSEGAIVQNGSCPSFSLHTIIASANAGEDLIVLPNDLGSVEKVILGFDLAVQDGKLEFAAVVTLVNAKLPGETEATTITLEDFQKDSFKEQLKSAFLNLLNAGLQVAIEQVKGFSLFQNAYSVLSTLGLALPKPADTDFEDLGWADLGINASGWTGLLSNPFAFIEDQLLQLIASPDNRTLLIQTFEAIFGITIPKIPTLVLDFLAGLQIVGPASENYPLNALTLLEIAANPVGALKTRFEALFNDTETLDALAKELTQTIPTQKFGYFEFKGTSNGTVILEIPADAPFKIGEGGQQGEALAFLEVSGALELSFINKTLTGTLNSFIPLLGMTLANAFSLNYKAGTVGLDGPTAILIWGTKAKPAAAPLQILPFNSERFVHQVADIAPAYALNIFLNAIFEEELVNKYRVVQSVFELLGVSRDTDGIWTMPSLLGLMTDPMGWLLSDAVLGKNGQFNIAKLVEKLSVFPEASYQPPGADTPITIGPNPAGNGLSITGLPYSFFVEIWGDDTTGTANFGFGCKQIPISEGNGELDNLLFNLGLTADYQPSFSGSFDLATTIGTELFTTVGFDKNFLLRITEGTPATPGLVLQLLPFTGWGQLAADAGAFAAAQVINEVVPQILNYLQPKAPEFVQAMNNFGNQVPVKALIDALIAIVKDGSSEAGILEQLEEAALAWLQGLFKDPTQRPKTISAIEGIFHAVPNVGSIQAINDSLLEFQPSDQLPIVLYFGFNSDNNLLGIWAGLSVPNLQYIAVNVSSGVGVNIDTLTDIEFDFDFDVILPLGSQYGPGLFLKYDPSTFFNLGFDPFGDSESPRTQSKYAIELVPVFFGKNGQPPADLAEAVEAWILEVIKNVLPRYISILVLNNQTVLGWLQYNLFAPISSTTVVLTPLDLLIATTLVIKEDGDQNDEYLYFLNSIDAIAAITPLGFLGNFLKTLLENDITLLKFGETGSISIGKSPTAESSYGVRIAAPNLKIQSFPNIVLQLGAENSEWIKKSWSEAPEDSIEPGIQFYVPITFEPEVSIDFDKFNIILGNIGFDIVGQDGQPIVDLSRFKLGGVEPRVLFDIEFDGSNSPRIVFGGNLTLADMGVSLAPNQLTGSGATSNSQNPIASNLLGSGSEAEDSSKENPPSNPTFSAQVAYTDQLWVNLVSTTSEGKEIVIPIQRAFGPLFVNSLGVGWDDTNQDNPLLDVLFTGDVNLAGLKVSLVRLDIGIPVTTPTDYSAYKLDLAGLDVNYQGGSVVINAGLLKQELDGAIQYTGSAVLKAGTFSIMALGSYAQVPDPDDADQTVTSLFIFGSLNMPLGGVPAFFITGVAAGFGYNRSLKIPPIEQVVDFPLVAGVLNGNLTQDNDPDSALEKLASIVSPQVGQYWLAAGLKFKSFELINTAALLFIQFGRDFEIDLLGLSYASLPPELSKENALAYFELAIKVSIKPSEGVISAEAQLTPNSFVLTRDCKVTGGFAFYLWFKNITQVIENESVEIPKGQFVITLGGYHPQFQAPKYYPSVPRLGMLWNMDFGAAKLSISGGTYFAICPTAVMAGGYLNASFQAGPLKAWLDAYANFLIEWNPFYFNVGIGVTVGASFGFTVAGVAITVSAELGAKLKLQGPPVNGEVEVDWYVISFTIPFGDKTTETNDTPLGDWDAFSINFLPPPEDPEHPTEGFSTKSSRLATLETAGENLVQQVLKWNAASGLQNSDDNKSGTKSTKWIFGLMFYSIEAQSVVPANKVTVKNTGISKEGPAGIGIRPMDVKYELEAPMELSIEDNQGNPIDIEARQMVPAELLDGAPGALWSQSSLNREQAPDSEDMIIKNALLGLSLSASRYLYVENIPAFPVENLKYTYGNTRLLPFYLTPAYPPATKLSQEKPFTQIMNSVMKAEVIEARNAVYAALADLQPLKRAEVVTNETSSARQLMLKVKDSVSIEAPLNPDLSVMASSANLIFQVFPVIASIGVFQNNGNAEQKYAYVPPTAKTPVQRQAQGPKIPEMQGQLRRYLGRAAHLHTHLPEPKRMVDGKWTCYKGYDVSGKPINGGTAAPSYQKKLYEGGAVLWKLDPTAQHKLELSGALSVLVASFDKYQCLIDIHQLDDSAQFFLPTGTAEAALWTYDHDDLTTVGWQSSSTLVKLNAQWALGDNCLVHVQSAQRIPLNHRRDRSGLIEAARLTRQNRVRNAKDELQAGWINTAIFTKNPYLAVLVDKEQAKSIKVDWAFNKMPRRAGTVKPVRQVNYLNQSLLIYQVAEQALQTETFIGLMIGGGKNEMRVNGVFSLSDPASKKAELWKQLSLHPGGLNLQEDLKKIKTATITLTI